jgi:NAD(P)-dependent dehydrogenase (short-subunit alcohol dehydrogenase family)
VSPRAQRRRKNKREGDMQELRFDGRSVIVTGGGRGVGRSYAHLLAARGARVLVADNGGALDGTGAASPGPADEVVEEIKAAGGEAVACYDSVADLAGGKAIVEAALDSFGRLDAVINNAGISDPEMFDDVSFEQIQRMLDVHYLGTLYVLKAAWPHLRAAGYGRVVNTCAEGMLGIHKMNVSYAGSKGGVFGITRALAIEGEACGVLVNGISPRATTRLANPEIVAKVHNRRPEEMKLAYTAPELAAPVAAYLSHESCRLSGEVLVAGGGKVMRLVAMESKGLDDRELTPERLAENLDTVMDLTDAAHIPILLGRK